MAYRPRLGPMAARKGSEAPQVPVPREFRSVDEVDRAIEKLRRRVDELAGLSTSKARWDGPERRTAEQNIRGTVLEVYGPHSPEYRAHQQFEIWHGGHFMAGYGPDRQLQFEEGIADATAALGALLGGWARFAEIWRPAQRRVR